MFFLRMPWADVYYAVHFYNYCFLLAKSSSILAAALSA
jgi:hypothetical protein